MSTLLTRVPKLFTGDRCATLLVSHPNVKVRVSIEERAMRLNAAAISRLQCRFRLRLALPSVAFTGCRTALWSIDNSVMLCVRSAFVGRDQPVVTIALPRTLRMAAIPTVLAHYAATHLVCSTVYFVDRRK